jgi:HSP20 family molecular chaperone IbpA
MSFPVDICETEDAFILVGELPGVAKDAVNIRLAENELAITGRFDSALKESEHVALHEVPGADYRRSFTLSDAVDREEISAELKDGLLTVKLAKSEKTKPRQIEIT